MAIKTFTTGEVLTAADTNTYLANSGLVFVKQVTVGSSATSIPVTSAFSSTYDNYKIIIAGGVGSTTENMRVILGATVTGYAFGGYFVRYNTGVGSFTGSSTAGTRIEAGYVTANGAYCELDLVLPNAAKRTGFRSSAGALNDWFAIHYQGFIDDATQYTDFTVSFAGAASLTGGTITVYGYRKG
jgi:hypothetical protein